MMMQGRSLVNPRTQGRSSRPRRMRRSALAALVAGGVLATSACSSGADPKDVTATQTPFSADSSAPSTAASNPSANTSPSPGSVVSSDHAFNFVVPSGWNLSSQPKTVAYLSSATLAHDVAPTIVVARSSVTPAPELEGTLRLATLQAKQGGKSVGSLPDRTVGGEKAVGFTATSTERNVDLKRSYVMVAHDKVLYSITLTGAEVDAARDEAALSALLANWTWTKAGVAGSTASGTTPAAAPTTTIGPSSSSSAGGASTSGSASASPGAASSGSARASSTPTSSAQHSASTSVTAYSTSQAPAASTSATGSSR